MGGHSLLLAIAYYLSFDDPKTAKREATALVNVLLKACANPKLEDHMGRTGRDLAKQLRIAEIVGFLSQV
ncbi:hypothetical protein HN588_00650 [Candidatus Bathyarchaeota archaeon]|jgi:hypothetical protein|nr:hypothetical protein [Candidatus Bathyarchaeota archaeon]